MHPLSCPTEQELSAFHLGNMPPELQDTIADHLDACVPCEAALERLETQTDPILAALRCDPVGPDSPGFDSTRPETAPFLPAAGGPPGYDLLEFLGEGGMGIVYKARHRQLNRLVALKMLQRQTPSGLARFRTEAEAVARLQHPNIIQIFEVGENRGQAFLTLEFVDGGSLAQRIAGAPQPVSDSALLVRTLADAVHHAHTSGVIHRDLKPANVLLTADGAVKISDFGLAKRLDSDALQTQSGDLLGTPRYMAPEQAQPRQRESAVGPAADIHALGAILYEMIAGRPPFEAATALDTLFQVLHQEPLPLGRLRPGTPIDLETIVHKCLQKDPRHRYTTALALAQDLERFLDGKPIAARPIGSAERLGRWAKRNPGLAGLTAAVLGLLVVVTVGAVVSALVYREQADMADKARQDAKREADIADMAREAAKREADIADMAREAAKREADIADKAREAAKREADTAKQISEFLTGLFDEMDPLALGGRSFGLRMKSIDREAAIGLLDRGKDKLKGMLRDRPAVRAALLDRIGTVYVSLGSWDRGKPLLEEALALRLKTLGAEHADVATSYLNLGDCFLMLDTDGEDQRTIAYYRQALALRRKLFGNDDPRTAEVLLHLGGWQGLRGKTTADALEGEKLLEEARAINKRHFGHDSREHLLPMLALAQVHFRESATVKLLALVPQIMAIMKKQPNLQELEHAVNLLIKGKMALLFGRPPDSHKLAKAHWEEGLARAEPLLGETNLLIMEARRALAYHFLYDMKDYEAATAHYTILAERFHKMNPRGSESEATMLFCLYKSQADWGLGTDAALTRTRGIAAYRAISRRGYYFVRLLHDEGESLANNGKLEQAAALFKEAVAESFKTEKWWVTGGCVDSYADTLVKLGKRSMARATLEENLAYLEEMMIAKAKHAKLSAVDYHSHAWRCSRLSGLVGEDPQALTREEKIQRQKLADRAMKNLQAARLAGFNDVRDLQESPGWASLCEREDFQRLLKELRKTPKK